MTGTVSYMAQSPRLSSLLFDTLIRPPLGMSCTWLGRRTGGNEHAMRGATVIPVCEGVHCVWLVAFVVARQLCRALLEIHGAGGFMRVHDACTHHLQLGGLPSLLLLFPASKK